MSDLVPLSQRLPQVIKVAVNQGRGVYGSFIDPEWVWHYVEAGQWEFRLESKSYLVGPGDMILLPPRLLHVVRPLQGKRLVQWVIHFEWPGGLFHSNHFPFVVVTRASARPSISALFAAMQKEWQRRDLQYKTVSGGLAMALIGFHFRHGTTQKTATLHGIESWPSIEKAISFIQENYARPEINLSDIGHSARLSPNYLCRVFKRCLGLSVMHYLAFYRVQKAEELLISSSLNCSEIAEEVGFNSVHGLSRIFHKFKGMPPTSYRQVHQG